MISTKNLLLSFLGVGAIGGATVGGYYAFNKEETSNKVNEERQPAQDSSLNKQQSQQERALGESPSARASTGEDLRTESRVETGSSSTSSGAEASASTSSTGTGGVVAEAK